ncbi:MAG: VRR-NUC domain-containing protein [Phycisphaeraceae bacterium]
MATERQIQNAILRTFATRRDVRLWRQNTGAAPYRDAKGQKRLVRFGVPGQADLSGILPGGVRLEIEVKGPKGRQSHEQQAFQRMIERFGGVYVLARSVQDVQDAIGGYLHEDG